MNIMRNIMISQDMDQELRECAALFNMSVSSLIAKIVDDFSATRYSDREYFDKVISLAKSKNGQ